jgi:flagellar hook-length control protein FliK
MNVNFSKPAAPDAAAAPRAEKASPPAAANTRTTELTSFESTLTRSRRELRSRDDTRSEAREAAPREKAVPARKGKAQKASGSTGQEEVAASAPVEPKAAHESAELEPAAANDGEQQEDLCEAIAQDPDETVEVAVSERNGEVAAAQAVAAVAAVTVAGGAAEPPITTKAVESVAGQPPSSVGVKVPQPKSATAVKPSSREAAPPVDIDIDRPTPVAANSTGHSEGRSQAPSSGDAVVESISVANRSDPLKPEVSPVSDSLSTSTPAEMTLSPASLQPASPPPVSTSGAVENSALIAQQPRSDDSAGRDDVNLGKVVRGLSTAINQRGGSVTLRLTPPDLGAVRIDMTIRDGAVSARFTAQTESVRNLLTDQMSHLRQALDRQGLVVEKIEVQALPPQSASGGFDRQMDDAGRDGRSAGQFNRQRGDEGSSGRPRLPWQRSDGEIDTFDRALIDAAR